MDYQKSLNGLRGFAFLQVLIEHYLIPIFLLPTGVFGVNLFFVLSSFLLTSILYKQIKKYGEIKICNYIMKRILRIYPCLLISLILEVLVQRLTESETVEIFFLISAKSIYWTIFSEMRSYVFIPLFVLLFYKYLVNVRSRVLFISSFFIISLIWHIFVTFVEGYKMNLRNIPFPINSIYANLIFINFFPIFAFGSFAAIINEDYLSPNYKFLEYFTIKNYFFGILSYIILFAHIILIISVAIFKYVFGINLENSISTENLSLIFSLLYSIMIILMNFTKENLINKFLEMKIFIFLGNISFPGYLFNLSITKFYMHFFNMKNTNLITIIISLLTLMLFCYFIHHTVEIYFINLSKKLFLNTNELIEKERITINSTEILSNEHPKNIVLKDGKNDNIEKGYEKIPNNIYFSINSDTKDFSTPNISYK